MLKWLGKLVVEKVVGLLLVLLAIGIVALVWRYHEHLPSWGQVGYFLGALLLWLVLAALLPWATCFLVAWVHKAENNLPAIALLAFWAAADAAAAWWLAGGPTAWRIVAAALAFCAGGLYNLIAANQIANRRRV